MTEIFRPPFFQPDAVTGAPLAGALLYFYAAGTTTPITTYTDSGLGTPQANPVVADASGIFAPIYVNTATYKIVLKTSAGVTVYTADNIVSTAASTAVTDSTFRIQDDLDATRQIAFQASSITAGQTRTITVPDKSGTMAMTSDLVAAGASATQMPAPINLGLAATVAASALTVAIKGVDGTDPSATNPVYIPFRNVTAATGTPTYLTITAATSLVISSGSTLGMTSAVAARLWLVAFNDSSTLRLGLVNPLATPTDGINSSTAEGGAGAADSAGVIYTGTAVTSKAMTVIGYMDITEATAGTWASVPTTLTVATPGVLASILPRLSAAAAVASTSGTSIDFTGIPAGVRRITCIFNGVSTSGTNPLLIQIGAGSNTNTGYVSNVCNSQAANVTGATSDTTGFIAITGTTAAGLFDGTVTLLLQDPTAFKWVASVAMSRSDVIAGYSGSGHKTLAGVLDRVRFTTTGSTDTFDAGTVNIMYEF